MNKAHCGIIGLGTMGRNFLLNIAQRAGIASVGYDLDAKKRELLAKEGMGMPVAVAGDLDAFLATLESPRNIILFVPAGSTIDSVIADLIPSLDADDLIIDGADSHFSDTERREAELSAKNIGFLGVGFSGGKAAARYGPSIMAGGRREYYNRIEHIFHATAMLFNRPCAGYVGTGSAGHFVKMVHNGVEYAMMQQLTEAYDYMRRVLRMNIVLTQEAFAEWEEDGELNSCLVRITSDILRKYDKEARQPLVDLILDAADQNGTEKWTSQAALDLGVPVPAIDAAVTMRQISAQKALREEIELLFKAPTNGYNVKTKAQLEDVHDALYCGFVLAYEQGFSLLRAANEEKSYGFDLVEIAGIWGFGSTIWSKILHQIAKVYSADTQPSTLLLDKHFSDALYKNMAGLRKVVSSGSLCRIPMMALAASLNYYTSFRTERLPASLVQAQRDYFGAGEYRRIDKEGTFHTPDWDVPTY